MKYSIIVPVYNRPDEVDELLQSLCEQEVKDFEVIIVEDGSKVPCEEVCRKYEDRLQLKYFMKPNSGPGQSRNYGAERASGEWLIVLDSDVVLPKGYLKAVEEATPANLQPTPNPSPREGSSETLSADSATSEANQSPSSAGDATSKANQAPLPWGGVGGGLFSAFGGPDASHPSFTPVQKAISYSMTSFFTTGGIRGGKAKLDKFYPRSYNMGIRREVYQQLGGFSKMRFGEDIDFSYRIVEAGYKTALLPDAWVWHKRRTDFRKFFRQVFNSGIARINLEKRHPGTMKLVHMLPMVFTVGVLLLTLIALVALVVALVGLLSATQPGCNMGLVLTYAGLAVAALALSPLLLYAVIICIDSTRKNRSLRVGLLSVPAAFTQLMGYGLGFLKAWWKRIVLRQDEFTAFEKNFYK
jgi:glycosyltransferase involved in cell wall biosynthesis